jgi:CRISPR-associated protein (TIGR03984 family)
MSDFAETINELPKGDEVRSWLEGQMNGKRSILLVFADDGVIWGKLDADNKVALAPRSPALRAETLQQAFVFGKEDEVRLFHDEAGNWQARRIMDSGKVITESQILWGNQSEANVQDGFLRVSEFRSGIPDQFLPVNRPLGNNECIRLEVHHMVIYEETGEARIAISRLAGLSIDKRDLEVAK